MSYYTYICMLCTPCIGSIYSQNNNFKNLCSLFLQSSEEKATKPNEVYDSIKHITLLNNLRHIVYILANMHAYISLVYHQQITLSKDWVDQNIQSIWIIQDHILVL